MSEYTQYYNAFCTRLGSGEGLPADRCRCHGGGWILSEVDTWHQCPDHFTGQGHPEDNYQADMEALERLDAPAAIPQEDAPAMDGAGLLGDDWPF